jgi:cation diffusion facilitator family transporter
MHTHSLRNWQHEHAFLGERHEHHERRTGLVVALTAAMMVAEIVGGTVFGSMALVADGWHMFTHAAALAIAALAYRFARTHAHDPRFSFGTGKLGELAAFASAIILALIALFIGYESAARLVSPVPISFGEAIPIAVVGLGVNLASAWLLHDDDGHAHDREHGNEHDIGRGHHEHPHSDTNIRAAYVHVLADALTSILAIIALVAGLFFGWVWLDPVMGLVGAVVIAAWSMGLIRSAGAILLDTVPSQDLVRAIRERLEVEGDRVADLHLWKLGPGHMGLIVVIVSDRPRVSSAYKERLADFPGLSHVTVEVQLCPSHFPRPLAA